MVQFTRRNFLKLGATGAAAAAGVTALGFDLAQAIQVKQTLRIAGAKESHSLCPYCAVGCSLVAYTTQTADGATRLVQIEGDPDSPVNEGRLCPKGASAMQLAITARRADKPLYRAPGSDHWEEISWDALLDRLAGERSLGGDQLGRAPRPAGATHQGFARRDVRHPGRQRQHRESLRGRRVRGGRGVLE